MKLMSKFLAFTCAALFLSACGGAPEQSDLSDEQSLRSYAVGAASMREARQLLDNVKEEYPDLQNAEKQHIIRVGFVDLLHLEPQVDQERFQLDLMGRGLLDKPLMTGLPEREEFVVDEEDETAHMLYTLGAYMAVQVLMVNDFLAEIEQPLAGNAVVEGFMDTFANASRMSEEEIDEQWEIMLETLTSTQEQNRANAGSENLALGLAYQEENAQREGVVVTASGLQYEVLREGNPDGASPSATDVVEVHYEGSLVTGEVFDSSYQRGESISFPLNRVISGWTEGLQLMTVGAKYRFVIPAELAYGATERANGVIQPNSTLVFEVELIDVVSANNQ